MRGMAVVFALTAIGVATQGCGDSGGGPGVTGTGGGSRWPPTAR